MFTVPQTGEWRVSFSLKSAIVPSSNGKSNSVYILHNEEENEESKFETYSQYYGETTTGGRELVLRAEQGDTLALKADIVNNNNYLYSIITCFEFLFP